VQLRGDTLLLFYFPVPLSCGPSPMSTPTDALLGVIFLRKILRTEGAIPLFTFSGLSFFVAAPFTFSSIHLRFFLKWKFLSGRQGLPVFFFRHLDEGHLSLFYSLCCEMMTYELSPPLFDWSLRPDLNFPSPKSGESVFSPPSPHQKKFFPSNAVFPFFLTSFPFFPLSPHSCCSAVSFPFSTPKSLLTQLPSHLAGPDK